MRVLLTGATGFVGSAALRALEERSHNVTVLVRSDKTAARMVSLGHKTASVDLSDLPRLRELSRGMQAVIHCAASDNSDFWPISESAAGAMMDGLDDGAVFATHGGSIVFGPTGTAPSTPQHFSPPPPLIRRAEVDKSIVTAAGKRLTAVLAYGSFVYGGKGAALPELLINVARRTGIAAYPGNGQALWSSVHVDDFGALLVDAIENARAGHHSVFAADATISIKEAALAVGHALALPSQSIDGAAADDAFGPFAKALLINQVFSDLPARSICKWTPKKSSIKAFKESLVSVDSIYLS